MIKAWEDGEPMSKTAKDINNMCEYIWAQAIIQIDRYHLISLSESLSISLYLSIYLSLSLSLSLFLSFFLSIYLIHYICI